jgi:hypothetical protein
MRRPGFFHLISGHSADHPSKRVRPLHLRRPRLRAERQLRVLRDDHPLARSTDALRCTGRQWNHVAAVLAGSVIALAQGGRWAAGLVCSAGGVLVVLSLMLAFRLQARRDCVTDVILEGDEDLPVTLVQRERVRLISPRNRVGVARSLEKLAREATAPQDGRARLVPPLVEPPVVAQVADELRELGAVLRTEAVSARGVARLERLVSRATSPLYGRDIAVLREELSRVRWLLDRPNDGGKAGRRDQTLS